MTDAAPAPCRVDGCERKHSAMGLCALHYRRKRDGIPNWDSTFQVVAIDGPEDLSVLPLGQVVRTFAHVVDSLRRSAHTGALPSVQYDVLGIVDTAAGTHMAKVARMLGVSPQSMGFTADALEAAGLIERRMVRGEGRVKRCFITDEGRRALEDGRRGAERAESLLVATLGSDAKPAIEAMIRAVAAGVANADTPRCSNGHLRTEHNAAVGTDGTQRCQACRRESQRRHLGKKTADDVTDEQHGTATGYRYGCRCIQCQQFHTQESQRWRAKRGKASAFADDIARGILADISAGVSVAESARRAGVTPQSVYTRARTDDEFGRRFADARSATSA